jgi:hypothetical protein
MLVVTLRFLSSSKAIIILFPRIPARVGSCDAAALPLFPIRVVNVAMRYPTEAKHNDARERMPARVPAWPGYRLGG